jgi:hypothetical protein
MLRTARQDLERDVAHHAMTSEIHQGLLVVLERVGLRLEMRDTTSWGYRWFSSDLLGGMLHVAMPLKPRLPPPAPPTML